jgi:hypothetical protein
MPSISLVRLEQRPDQRRLRGDAEIGADTSDCP